MNDNGMSRGRFLSVGMSCGLGYHSSSITVLLGGLVLRG